MSELYIQFTMHHVMSVITMKCKNIQQTEDLRAQVVVSQKVTLQKISASCQSPKSFHQFVGMIRRFTLVGAFSPTFSSPLGFPRVHPSQLVYVSIFWVCPLSPPTQMCMMLLCGVGWGVGGVHRDPNFQVKLWSSTSSLRSCKNLSSYVSDLQLTSALSIHKYRILPTSISR